MLIHTISDSFGSKRTQISGDRRAILKCLGVTWKAKNRSWGLARPHENSREQQVGPKKFWSFRGMRSGIFAVLLSFINCGYSLLLCSITNSLSKTSFVIRHLGSLIFYSFYFSSSFQFIYATHRFWFLMTLLSMTHHNVIASFI